MDAPIDDSTKRTVQKIPLLTTRAGPRDGEEWTKRLKEEYLALIQVRTDEY
jgi:ufm1-conjugating enzyme 1